MYFKKWEELKVFHPIEEGIWNKELLLQAQKNEVEWKRPFQRGEYLKWL